MQIPSEIGIEGVSIRFLGDKNAKVWFQFLDLNGNWSEKKAAKIFPEPNSLLIFPPWVWHKVLMNEEDTDRISLSFNTQFQEIEKGNG